MTTAAASARAATASNKARAGRRGAGFDYRAEVEAPPDRGCWAAPACIACPWRCCVLDMSAAETRELGDALRVLQAFARPDLRAG